MTRLLPLHARDGSVKAYAFVDDADFADVSRYSWHLASTGYATRKLPNGNKPGCHASTSADFNHDAAYKGGGQITLHRQLMGLAKGDAREVDHINRDKLDDRRRNLRIVSRAEQAQNVPPIQRTSRHRGVYFDRATGRWGAHARIDRQDYWLGRHASEQAAANAAATFRREHMPFSEDARVAS